jgi:hypothetical protein
VLSYTSMFEGFWREDEIYEKLKESRTQLNLTRFLLPEQSHDCRNR